MKTGSGRRRSEEGQQAWAEIRYETVLRSDINLPAGMPSVDELAASAKIEPNYSEEQMAERYDAVTEICLKMLGFHSDIKGNYDNPEELDSYLERWVEEPLNMAELQMSYARTVIKEAKEMSLTGEGQQYIISADGMLAEAETEYDSCNYEESYKFANMARIFMSDFVIGFFVNDFTQ